MNSSSWRTTWQQRVQTPDELVRFVDAVGFCTIAQLERYPEFPSVAVAMGKPDALWHTWFWKDDLHVERRVYYTRLFTGKPGFIALDWLPAFIATNGEVFDEAALLGTLPAATQELYRLIDANGPIATGKLKQRLPQEGRKAATTMLLELERRFMITKTAITGRELSTYSYIWDLAERWLPDAFTAADRLGAPAATARILAQLATLGVPVTAQLTTRVLRWQA